MRIIIEVDSNDFCAVLDDTVTEAVSASTLRKIKNAIREAPEYLEYIGGDADTSQIIEQDDVQGNELKEAYQEINDYDYWDRQSTKDQIALVEATFESLTTEILEAAYNPNSPYEVELLKQVLDDVGYKF